MANFREWSSEEIEERLKNEQYRLVFPLRLRKSSKTSSENTGNQKEGVKIAGILRPGPRKGFRYIQSGNVRKRCFNYN